MRKILCVVWAAVVAGYVLWTASPRLAALGTRVSSGWSVPTPGLILENAGRHAGTVLLAAAIGLVAAGSGANVLPWLAAGAAGRTLRPFLLVPLGAVAGSLLLFGLLLVRLWFLPVMIAVVAVPAIPWLLRRGGRSTGHVFRIPPAGDPARPWMWVALAGALVWLPWSLAPESHPDAYEYFLAGPERWLVAHGLSVAGAPATQAYPALAEILFAFPVAAGLEGAAKLLNALILMSGVGGFLAVAASSSAARWAGVAAAVTSVSGGWFFTTGKNEGFGAGFLLLALAAGLAGRGSAGALRLSALLAGGALSTKIIAAANLGWIPLVVIPVWWGRGFPALVRWSALAAAVALPWWAKSWLLFADPWYPVLSGMFPAMVGHDARHAAAFRITTGGTAFRPDVIAATLRSLAIEHAVLAALLPVVLFTPGPGRIVGAAAAGAYAVWHALFAPVQLARWAFPTIAPALLLAGAALPGLDGGRTWTRRGLAVVAAAGWLMALAVREGDPNPLPYLTGAESAGAYEARLLTTLIPARRQLAAARGAGAVLLAGEVRGYRLPQPVVVAGGQAAGDPHLCWTIAHRSATPERMAVAFRQRRIDRVLVNPIVLMRAAGSFAPFDWNRDALDRYAEFIDRWWALELAPTARDHINGCAYLYRIRRAPRAERTPYVLHLPGAESELTAIVDGHGTGGAAVEIGRVHADLARLPRVLQFEHVAAAAELAAGDPATAYRFTAVSVARGWLDDDNVPTHALAAIRTGRFDDAVRALALVRTGYPGWESWADRLLAECRFHRAVVDLRASRWAVVEHDMAEALAALPPPDPGRGWLPSRAGLLRGSRALALFGLHRDDDARAELARATVDFPDLGLVAGPDALAGLLAEASASLQSANR